MNVITGIYKITSPSGKIYIGQSVDVINRFYQYKQKKGRRQTKLYSSFVCYGVENHLFELLEECSIEELNNRERFYIKKYNSFNTDKGLNLTSGGGSNGHISDETKSKISKGNKGKKVTVETKIRMSKSQKKTFFRNIKNYIKKKYR